MREYKEDSLGDRKDKRAPHDDAPVYDYGEGKSQGFCRLLRFGAVWF